MNKFEKLKLLKRNHNLYIKSLGVNININTGKIYKKFTGYTSPDYTLDINGIKRNSIQPSNRIAGVCYKQSSPKVNLPAGKTIGIAYNKGNYQIIDSTDFKTMGRKI